MQLEDFVKLTITSGNIGRKTILSNKELIHFFDYDKSMENDAFIHLIYAGSLHFTSSCTFDLEMRSCYQFLYPYEGKLEVTCSDGTTYVCQPGHLLFLSPSAAYSFHIKSSQCHFFLAGLSGAALKTYRGFLPCDISYIRASSGASCLPECIDHLLHHVLYHSEADVIMYSKWINDIFTELSIYAADSTRQRDQIPSYMAEMKELFDLKYQETYTLEELEQHFEKSRYRLCREFSQYFGQSPIQYLNHQRIEAAKYLLLSTDLSIHEVGSSVGIDNTNHFINLFKKETGATPLVFKQEAPVAISELHYPFAPDAR